MTTPSSTSGCGHRTHVVPGFLDQPTGAPSVARQFIKAGRVLLILSLTRAPPH